MDNLLNYKSLVAIYLACLAYTLTRYAYFGPIEPPNWPAYLINKSVSIFAVATFCYSSFAYFKGNHELSKQLGRIVWQAAVLHLLLSLALLNPGYYRGFYGQTALRFGYIGEFMMLFGSLSIFMMWQIPKTRELVQHRYKQLAAILVFLHILPTSITSEWHIPANWFGSLPPIGLIGGVASFITIILIWKYRAETNR